MNRLLQILFVFAFLMAPANHHCRAADEAEPKTVAEAKTRFDKADKELNSVYGDVRSALSKAEFAKLRDDQRKWLEYRDYMAERQAGLDNSNAMAEPHDTLTFWQVRTDLTRSRVDHLKARLGHGVPTGLAGYYEDSYGGFLKLLPVEGKLLFSLEVVRGPTSHTGEISGAAKLDGKTAKYSDDAKEHDDGQPTILNFRIAGNEVAIEGTNTSMYHGARAYFDGTYIKHRALTKEEASSLKDLENREQKEDGRAQK